MWRNGDNEAVEVDVAAEWIVLRKKEKPAAEIFHTYYKVADAKVRRPVTFVFNGGPGAASAYLHIGGIGPQRVAFGPNGVMLPPPTRLVENSESWIEFTDLVFVDPVGTGFSRTIEPKEKPDEKDKPDPSKTVDEKEFYALERDLESLGEFIERFLSKHKLWDVPIYIAGESYGGFRSAKLARRLQEIHGVGLTAAIAISPALEFSLLQANDYDVQSYVDQFCAMALAAAYHRHSRVLKGDEPIEAQREVIEAFATGELAHALLIGTANKQEVRQQVFAKVADFLGLSEDLVSRGHGRVPFWRFARELLKSEQKTLSFYDASVTAIDPFPDREWNEAPEPGLAGSQRLFVSGINHLLRSDLNVETNRKYEILNYDVNNEWKRDGKNHPFDAPAGAVDDLRYAMSVNPHMKVLITHGYYDMVTPYFSSERLAAQMKLLPEQRENLFIQHFQGGHMFYTWDKSRADFRDWVREYYV
ncbi:peptidase S10 [Capsulimonas corticalis]|uniref:Peptidase S10 n=1 Tax=Capsulimonas corticalis TaxID=2219043 RepID=A0A402CRY4_9BACT|nr:peptidase S10 [Capsulimonas corticalis]